MLDFSRAEFSKAISLNPKNLTIFSNPFENSKFKLVRLGEVLVDIINGSTPSTKINEYWNSKDIHWLTTPDFKENVFIENTSQFVSKRALDDGKVRLIPKDSVLLTCTATIGKCAINKIELTTNQQINALICKKDVIVNGYLVYILRLSAKALENLTNNPSVKHINLSMLSNFKIPLPPLEIQKQIVAECEKVEKQYNTIRMSIEEYQKLIKAILVKCGICEADIAQSTNSAGGGGINASLSSLDSIDIFIAQILAHIVELESKLDFKFLQSLNAEATNKESLTLDTKEFQNILNTLPIPPKEGWERKRLSDKTKFGLSIGKRVLDSELNPKGNIPVYSANVKKPFGFIDKEILKDYENDSVLWGIDGDWLVSFMPKNTPFYPTDHCGVLRVNGGEAKLIAYILGDEGERARFSRTLRASIERIAALKIAFPHLKSQQQIVNVIENIESHIVHLDSISPLLESKKQEILKEFLMQ